MNPDDYPEISDLLVIIQNWDREANADSFGAGAYAMMYYNLGKYYPKLKEDKVVSQKMLEECLKEVKLKMIESFGSINIRLGDYQKLVRGDKEISIFGLPDVLTAMRGVDYKDGKIKITHGESYIELVKFSKGKVEIESVISYGSSDHEDSPHYNDQMEMYSKFETKKMTFNKEKIYKNSKKIYNPK
jgi:acyl-homoserine-lactone acylase